MENKISLRGRKKYLKTREWRIIEKSKGGWRKKEKCASTFLFACPPFLVRAPSLVFDLRVPLLLRLVLLWGPHPLHPWFHRAVSRAFIRWRKECAPFGLVISLSWPTEGESLTQQNPVVKFFEFLNARNTGGFRDWNPSCEMREIPCLQILLYANGISFIPLRLFVSLYPTTTPKLSSNQLKNWVLTTITYEVQYCFQHSYTKYYSPMTHAALRKLEVRKIKIIKIRSWATEANSRSTRF